MIRVGAGEWIACDWVRPGCCFLLPEKRGLPCGANWNGEIQHGTTIVANTQIRPRVQGFSLTEVVLRILVACEESQTVTIALRKLGHEAYSCDIQECSGGHPEWHYCGDVLALLDQQWDMLIAFPPCTYLTNAGTRHFSLRCNPFEKVQKRKALREEAAAFFRLFADHSCPRIAVENPVGYMNSTYRQPDQTIHPYYFGDPFKKRTCLWLKGLPLLVDTHRLPEPKPLYFCEGEKCFGKPINWCESVSAAGGQAERAKTRSKTFQGIADAMAMQWAGKAPGWTPLTAWWVTRPR